VDEEQRRGRPYGYLLGIFHERCLCICTTTRTAAVHRPLGATSFIRAALPHARRRNAGRFCPSSARNRQWARFAGRPRTWLGKRGQVRGSPTLAPCGERGGERRHGDGAVGGALVRSAWS
jgi:hypothetical protein